MNHQSFISPRLTGERFEGGVIPLELLADFAVFQQMIVEVAKWKFKQANPTRKRIPRGFAHGISLRLTKIESGSARPIIELFFMSSLLFPPETILYLTEAKTAIVEAIGAADTGGSIRKYLPENLLGYFNWFGRNLDEGEAIEFDGTAGTVRLTKENRRKLVQAATDVDDLKEEIILQGAIYEADLKANTFHIETIEGKKHQFSVDVQHLETALDALNSFKEGIKVRLFGVGIFDRSNRLSEIESVEHIFLLDKLDIDLRLDQLKLLNDGWLDGEGIAPNKLGLDWLAIQFLSQYPEDLPLPYIFPTPMGNVRLEWSINGHEASLEIDLTTHVGKWHSLNLETDQEDTFDMGLAQEVDWQQLAQKIRDLIEDKE